MSDTERGYIKIEVGGSFGDGHSDQPSIFDFFVDRDDPCGHVAAVGRVIQTLSTNLLQTARQADEAIKSGKPFKKQILNLLYDFAGEVEPVIHERDFEGLAEAINASVLGKGGR